MSEHDPSEQAQPEEPQSGELQVDEEAEELVAEDYDEFPDAENSGEEAPRTFRHGDEGEYERGDPDDFPDGDELDSTDPELNEDVPDPEEFEEELEAVDQPDPTEPGDDERGVR